MTSIDKERNKELKIFNKTFNKQKKQLIKYAKEFKPFDYGFMEKLLFQCIRIYYDFFKNSKLLYQDTKCEFNDWYGMVDSLKQCVEIINKLENVDYDTLENERELRNQLYELIKVHHTEWWD